MGGCNYPLTFIDDYFRYVWCYLIKTTDEAMGVFKDQKTMIEKIIEHEINTLMTDNGLELVKKDFLSFVPIRVMLGIGHVHVGLNKIEFSTA